jgi:putative transposase
LPKKANRESKHGRFGRSWLPLQLAYSKVRFALPAMESFFSSLKTERTANKIYRTRDEARADVFDYIERFYNTTRRHSTIGYLSPVEFERKVGLA